MNPNRNHIIIVTWSSYHATHGCKTLVCMLVRQLIPHKPRMYTHTQVWICVSVRMGKNSIPCRPMASKPLISYRNVTPDPEYCVRPWHPIQVCACIYIMVGWISYRDGMCYPILRCIVMEWVTRSYNVSWWNESPEPKMYHDETSLPILSICDTPTNVPLKLTMHICS